MACTAAPLIDSPFPPTPCAPAPSSGPSDSPWIRTPDHAQPAALSFRSTHEIASETRSFSSLSSYLLYEPGVDGGVAAVETLLRNLGPPPPLQLLSDHGKEHHQQHEAENADQRQQNGEDEIVAVHLARRILSLISWRTRTSSSGRTGEQVTLLVRSEGPLLLVRLFPLLSSSLSLLLLCSPRTQQREEKRRWWRKNRRRTQSRGWSQKHTGVPVQSLENTSAQRHIGVRRDHLEPMS